MPYSFQEIKRKLLKLGFVIVRQKWSHVLFANDKIVFPIPNHAGKDISIGIEQKLYKLLDIDKQTFRDL